jgi:RNA-directed DNA polymerase
MPAMSLEGFQGVSRGYSTSARYQAGGRPESTESSLGRETHRNGVVEMKVIGDQLDTICHGETGESGTGAGALVEQQIPMALNATEDLTVNLMERVCLRANLNQAYKRVKSNKGAPGIDGMTVKELEDWIRGNKEQLINSLMDGSYQPQAVRKVEIPKPGKKNETRMLGIPTVVDRLVQQAIHQVLERIFDPTFSESSYGFRPGRKACDAVKRARDYVREGYAWCVDIDLAQFFDRVNHDILMSRLARRIKDKRLLKIIRRFLQAGIMENGVCIERYEGTPQGGPLSPLLSNILLDELDKELERRGHKFCRYADDQNIYVKTRRAGERVYESVKQFLEKKLKLKVNEQKSAVALVWERKFLGYRVQTDGRLSMAPETIRRAKDKIRELTRRNRGRSFELVIEQLNVYLRGWLNYYQLSNSRRTWQELDSWIRRKLRCYKLKLKKCGGTIANYLMSLGVSEIEARKIGSSGKGWWRLSLTRAAHRALDKDWFESQGLISLEERWVKLLNA